mmetsp:Transcript_25885/g.67883  ORF Transcript_25885/g.67883 Transcript_25885/m.67883 type:complete len:98 (-) Transcript_25885:69-362(-)
MSPSQNLTKFRTPSEGGWVWTAHPWQVRRRPSVLLTDPPSSCPTKSSNQNPRRRLCPAAKHESCRHTDVSVPRFVCLEDVVCALSAPFTCSCPEKKQ